MSSLYIILFIISIGIASYSQILLKKGSNKKNIYINVYTIIGYLLMLGSTVLTLITYKYINLSLGQLLQSLSFIFVTFLSLLLLKEKISKKKIIGIIIIIIGIVIFNY